MARIRTLFLEIWEAFVTAVRATGVHKTRSVLTTLGMVAIYFDISAAIPWMWAVAAELFLGDRV